MRKNLSACTELWFEDIDSSIIYRALKKKEKRVSLICFSVSADFVIV